MRNYFDPEMNISKFSVENIVTTSVTTEGGIVNPEENTNHANAQTYLQSKGLAAGNILSFD